MGDSLLDLVSRLVIDNLVLLVVDQILISELLSHLGLVVLENCAAPGSGCLAVAHLDNARGRPGGGSWGGGAVYAGGGRGSEHSSDEQGPAPMRGPRAC